MLRIGSCLALLVFWTNLILAQNATDAPVDSSAYFTSLRDRFSVFAQGMVKLNEIELRDAHRDAPLRYKPNSNFNVGFGCNYRWIGLGLAFRLGVINNDDQLYGKTEGLDLQTDMFTSRFLLTGSLQSYKGYYWENVDTYQNAWNTSDSVPIRPDIETFASGVNFFYALNHTKFSLKAVYRGTDWQFRTAGSWLVGGQASTFSMHADIPLVPASLAYYYPDFDSLVSVNTLNLGVNGGYSQTWVLRRYLYFNATLIVGLSLQSATAQDLNGSELLGEVHVSGKSHLRMSLGYNKATSYAGIMLVVDNSRVRSESNSDLLYKYGKVRLFYGVHF